VKDGTAWVDADFTGNTNVLYQSDTSRNSAFSTTVTSDLSSGALFAARFPVYAPTATIMHKTGDTTLYTDVQATNQYDEQFVAAMNAASSFPNLIKSVVLIQTKNTAGIYGFQFYIRGKPWHVAIDDNMFYTDPLPATPVLKFG